MNIRIVNLKNYSPLPNETLIKVDRSSILGNPYFLHCESQRNDICDLYEDYFNRRLNKTLDPSNDTKFDKALKKICDTLRVSDVALGCWCAPKRCHAETILDYIHANMRHR